jgi:pimeloyl-ACP methyl ester carboxylesterase
VQVTDRLGLQRVAIIGNSAGGSYALDCAYCLPGRVTACAVVSGVSEVGPLIRMLVRWMPWLLLLIMRRRFADQLRAQRSLERASRRWPEPDQRASRSQASLNCSRTRWRMPSGRALREPPQMAASSAFLSRFSFH